MKAKNKTSFGLPNNVIHQLHAIFHHYKQINQVILYGSRAMGNYNPGSDIDLCIDSDTLSLSDLLKIENQIDDLLLPWRVDISLKHAIDNTNLHKHIQNVGLIFYPSTNMPIKWDSRD